MRYYDKVSSRKQTSQGSIQGHSSSYHRSCPSFRVPQSIPRLSKALMKQLWQIWSLSTSRSAGAGDYSRQTSHSAIRTGTKHCCLEVSHALMLSILCLASSVVRFWRRSASLPTKRWNIPDTVMQSGKGNNKWRACKVGIVAAHICIVRDKETRCADNKWPRKPLSALSRGRRGTEFHFTKSKETKRTNLTQAWLKVWWSTTCLKRQMSCVQVHRERIVTLMMCPQTQRLESRTVIL